MSSSFKGGKKQFSAPLTRKHPRLDPCDYYYNEQGFMVFTEAYHLKRGYCCKSLCRHCPFGEKKN
jgi:hypothetical protein